MGDRESKGNGRDEIMERCLLLGNATLRSKTKRLEHVLPVHFVERIAEPARGLEMIRSVKVFSGAVGHCLINADLCLISSITVVSGRSQSSTLPRRSS